ncbi:threonine ammonia-lyase [Planktotalea sp.]|uniref:threonine ammonia-lyase n=1 Tax=Planktotalea sp. TaxID=2029877 RepID=UPI003F6D2DCC
MNIEMIRAAQKRGQGHVRYTPMLSSPFLDEIAGRRLFLKAECLQHTGSFKFRGGWSALSGMDAKLRAKGVIAFSSGNHAQGVALAAKMHGSHSVIIMPVDAPRVKIENTKALGAEVVLYDRETEDRDVIGDRLSKERGLTLVKPFDEPLVIAGQGTCGLEIAEQAQEHGVKDAEVITCCGGGGLTSGIAMALEAEQPSFKVRPSEPEGFDDVARSLREGTIQRNTAMTGSICDAIITPQPGDLTFPIMKRLCDAGFVVTEDECLRAMAFAFERLRVVIEPGGAAALAAALFHGNELNSDTVIVTASGGNVDRAVFERALATLE